MECIVCGADSGGHRVVVKVDSTTPIGGFCHACENTIFGSCFDRFQTETPAQCVFCGQDGAYVFLDWLEQMGSDEAPVAIDLSPPGETDAPAFCRTHFQALISDSTEWTANHQTRK